MLPAGSALSRASSTGLKIHMYLCRTVKWLSLIQMTSCPVHLPSLPSWKTNCRNSLTYSTENSVASWNFLALLRSPHSRLTRVDSTSDLHKSSGCRWGTPRGQNYEPVLAQRCDGFLNFGQIHRYNCRLHFAGGRWNEA